MRNLVLTPLVLVLAACGGSGTHTGAGPAAPTPAPAPTPPAPAADDGRISAAIQVHRRDGSVLRAGETLKTGDKFELIVTLDQPAYVYVGGLDAARTAYLLYPKPDDESAALPVGEHRFPRVRSRWMVTKPPAGPEVLFVIASRRPITDVDAALAVTVGELPADAPPPAPAPVAAPARLTSAAAAVKSRPDAPRRDPAWSPDSRRVGATDERGETRTRIIGEEDEAIEISAPDGVVVYPHPFDHVAP
jgi:hypothetical protein